VPFWTSWLLWQSLILGKPMQYEGQTKKDSINTLKNKCDAMHDKLTSIEAMTASRWKNIDVVIDKFVLSVSILLILNCTILAILFFALI